MEKTDTHWRLVECQRLVETLEEYRRDIIDSQRPAHEVLLDDVDLQKILKVSKRTTAGYREQRLITFSKIGGKIIYRLSDILDYVERNKVSAINANLKIR